MIFGTEAAAIGGYRERTKAGKMIGACFNTFLCPECKQKKSTKGRRSRGWKAGFRCAECVEKRAK